MLCLRNFFRSSPASADVMLHLVQSPSTPSETDSRRSSSILKQPQQPQPDQQHTPSRKMVAAQDVVFGLTNAAAAALCISGGVANAILFKLAYRPLLICALSVVSGLLLLLIEAVPRLSPWTTAHAGFLNSFTGRGIAYIILACFQFDTPLRTRDAWLYANAAGLAALGVLYLGLGIVDALSEDGIPKPRSMHSSSQRYTPTPRGVDVEAAVPLHERKNIMSYVSASGGSRFQEAGLLSHDAHAHVQRAAARPGTANSRTSEVTRSFWHRPSSAQGARRGHEPSGSMSTTIAPAPELPKGQYTQETVVVQAAGEGDKPELYFRALTFDNMESRLPSPSASAGPSREPSMPSLRLDIPAPAGPRRPRTVNSAASGHASNAAAAAAAEGSNNWRNSMPSGLTSAQRASRQHRTVSVAGVGDIELSSESESEDEIEDAQLLDSPKSVYGDSYEEAALKRKATLKQKRLAKIERGVERTLSLRADKTKRTQALRGQAGQ